MKLDFDIEAKGERLDFELEDTKVINTGGGVSESRVVQIVEEKTKELQPKTDESLETESKQVVGAINEVNSGLVKGINSSITEETNELVLELKGKDGTVLFSTKVQLPKSEIPDLSAYVKFTDRATVDGAKAGIVKLKAYGSGGLSIDGSGDLVIQAPSKSIIDGKKQNRPITPPNMDYAWKVSATTNTETWTDDDKAKACETIGAVGKKEIGDINTALETILGV